MNNPLGRDKSLVSMKRRKARQISVTPSGFFHTKNLKKGETKSMKDLLLSLLKESAKRPVTIMVKKGGGNDSNVNFQIEGDVTGILVLSVELMGRVAEQLKDKDDEILAIWLSAMLKRLSNVIDSKKENGDAKD